MKTPPLLDDEMLRRFAERAPVYDRENRFFSEDFEELQKTGYLTLAVPKELGGLGYSMAEFCHAQRRLAYHASATALAMNMHLYWTGIAADAWRRSDHSLDWLLEETINGAVFAAGHAESGHDIPVLLSTTRAERVEGGYRFTGHKSFGSLTPVWTFMGLHGLDDADPKAPKIVHAFLPRATEGITIKETWDVLGMRSTRSDDTFLENVFIPDRYIANVVPPGAAGLNQFVLGIFAWALLGFGNVYYGMAQRALDLVLAAVKKKNSLGLSRSMACHPGVQHGVAEMVLELEAIGPHLDRIADDWSAGVDHGAGWITKILAAKYHAVEASWRVVDRALDLAGGFGIFRKGPFEQLFRDARLGRLHPANSMLTHELCGKLALGISPDDQPRWG
ncbi:MAG: acyl-CoA/acyl-ACP dehydrogenase [Verrucomicrobiota bacterium]|nr:acyl-CoA/acyl-ACP dehydrogenase [Verrucomicrobiota bacterium]